VPDVVVVSPVVVLVVQIVPEPLSTILPVPKLMDRVLLLLEAKSPVVSVFAPRAKIPLVNVNVRVEPIVTLELSDNVLVVFMGLYVIGQSNVVPDTVVIVASVPLNVIAPVLVVPHDVPVDKFNTVSRAILYVEPVKATVPAETVIAWQLKLPERVTV
jgi:hypothetical protein